MAAPAMEAGVALLAGAGPIVAVAACVWGRVDEVDSGGKGVKGRTLALPTLSVTQGTILSSFTPAAANSASLTREKCRLSEINEYLEDSSYDISAFLSERWGTFPDDMVRVLFVCA